MSEKLLSIIIPVYNVKDYLEECLNSIIPQINVSCEIIMVDDGSTDGSGDICDKYASDNVFVIHQANGGLSAARNAGFDKSIGKFICYIDSDDRIDSFAFTSILTMLQDNTSDLIFMQAIKFYPDGSSESIGDNINSAYVRGKSKSEVFSYLSTRPKYPGSACTKIFRRSFLIQKGIHFPYDRRQSEDLGYCRDCIYKADSFDCFDIPYYEYRQNRKGSITNSKSQKSFLGPMSFVKETSDLMTVMKSPRGQIEKSFMSFVAYEYSVSLYNLSKLDKCQVIQLFAEAKKYQWTLKYSKSVKIKLIYIFSLLFGLRATLFALRIYKQ